MESNLNELIETFHNDAGVKQFLQRRSRKTIFETMNRLDDENAYSSFIAWLLNEDENPEVCQFVAHELMQLIGRQYQENAALNVLSRGLYSVRKSKAEREYYAYNDYRGGRIDIFAQCEIEARKTGRVELPAKVNIVIENKVYSDVQQGQLELYHDYVEKEHEGELNLYVLLAPKRLEYSEKEYIFLSYQDLVLAVLEPLLEQPGIPERVRVMTEDFIRALVTYHDEEEKKVIALCTTDAKQLISICQNHQELIDKLLTIQEKEGKIPFEYESTKDVLCELLYMASEIKGFLVLLEDEDEHSDRRKNEALKLSNATLGKVLYVIEEDEKANGRSNGKKAKATSERHYSMREIAAEVIRRYIEAHKEKTYEDLQEICRKSHNPGCNNELISDRERDDSGRIRHKKIKRLRVKGKGPDEKLHSICVSTQWTRQKTGLFRDFVHKFLKDEKFPIIIRRIS